jgi:hypothetical protein
MRKTLVVLACLATLLLGACHGDSNRPVATGEGKIRAINTIPTSPAILFLIEERSVAAVEFGAVSAESVFDNFEYIFNFEAVFPDNALQQRIASVPQKIQKDFEYTFLITGDLAAPEIIVWEEEIRRWQGTETMFQARFGHTAESLGAVDVYFAAPGIAPAAGQQIGTLTFGEVLPPTEFLPGEFVYTVTTAGNPADILFTSNALEPAAQAGLLITIFDGSENDLSPYSARIAADGGGVSTLPDANAVSTIRFIHAAATLDSADVYTDELLTEQIVGNHAYRDVTDDIELASGSYAFTYTSVGNVGSILFEGIGSVFPASHNQLYVIGETENLVSFIRIPDRRPVETQVKLVFIHTAVNHPAVDFYIVEAGTDIADVAPRFFNVTPIGAPLNANIDAGDLEFYLTVAGEKTVIAGPLAVTTSLGDVLEYLSFDNVDPATADLVLIPNP